MKHDADIRAKVNNYLKLDPPYAGETEVLHYLEVLRDKIGWENVKAAVKNPLTGRKIGAYYGCLLLRPSREMCFDDPENPTILEDFIRAIGAEPVYYGLRNECCGGRGMPDYSMSPVPLQSDAEYGRRASGPVFYRASGAGARCRGGVRWNRI